MQAADVAELAADPSEGEIPLLQGADDLPGGSGIDAFAAAVAAPPP